MLKEASRKAIVLQLLQAKKHSDRCEYQKKKEIIRHLLQKHPDQFHIDSRQRSTVGLTHRASGFKIHTPKSTLPDEFLYGKLSKTAFFNGIV